MLRIAILCNDRLGLPALQQLVQNRLVQAVATSDRSPEMVAIMQQVTAQGGVPSQVFTKKDFAAQLTAWLEQHKPDVVLVKTFPYRIPASALTIPKHGFINFHYAPLPAYRGPNPLFWMLKEGITTGGVAIHQMDEGFDSGPVLLQQPVPFAPDATFGICCTQLAYAGAQLTIQLLQGLQSGNLKTLPQEQKAGRWYGRPQPKDYFIHWHIMTAAEVNALAKACNPWMKGAPVKSKGWIFSITDAAVMNEQAPENALPGTILRLSAEEGLVIVCKDQTLVKVEVMYAEEGFFAGYHLARFGLKVGDRLD
jgi:methionyl-tRNA formyltransferase